jgi:methylphosphotriester-DNA--protein-cysteine methyltransferase
MMGVLLVLRVFFANEKDAIAAGYRPCGRCLRDKYNEWKDS